MKANSKALVQQARELISVGKARELLAACRSPDEAKEVRDKAKAVRDYLKRRKDFKPEALDAAEIVLRAERRTGHLLPDEIADGRPRKLFPKGTLSELGISRKQSMAWQWLAEVADEKFEGYIAEQRATDGWITTKGALSLATQVKRAAKFKDIADGAPSVAVDEVSPCAVLYADPPWQYDNTAGASAAEDHYPTMPLADICALKVPALDDCVLFLWATSPLLPEALQVMAAWDFLYKGSMVWDKGMGTGNWVLNAHEFLLIGVRGGLPCPAPENRPKSVVAAPRGAHSAKPDEFAKLIERMYPELFAAGGLFLEMFARRERAGWRVWGNQAA